MLDTGQSVVRVEVIKTALGVGAGAGAIVALVLAGRRQWTAERVAADAKLDAAERRVTELYTKAVEQLGSDKAAVRLGGLYALERLAQDRSQRQVVVNVICAYLRMPFTPSLEFDALGREDGQPKNSQPNSDRLATVVDDCISEDVQGDREELEVRLAAQDILFTHLCPNGPGYWGDTRLNLTGSVLVNFDLRACHVADVKFDRARFLGFASFEGTVFHGIANFVDAEFPYFTNFTSVEFQRGAWFSDAVFHGIPGAGEAAVHDARFSTKAAFEGATFCRAMFRDPALFRSVVFDGDARFDDATFYRGCTFSASTFRGAARFNRTKFIALAQFGNEDFEVNTYPAATFGHIVQFNGATFQVEARFEGARVLNPNSNLHAWPPGWRVDSTSSGATLQSESIATNVIIEGPDQPA